MTDRWKEITSRLSASPLEERVHMDAPDASAAIARALYRIGSLRLEGSDGLVVVCIGTDRSIGDALGPLVGTYLQEAGGKGYTVFGTVDNPVHASNLADTLSWIERNYRRPQVVALDACLGRTESIGMLTVGSGSVRPGAGVNKSLPPVGDLHVTGVVNVGGFMEYFVLQNTRLSLVMRMARVAAAGLQEGLARLAAEGPLPDSLSEVGLS